MTGPVTTEAFAEARELVRQSLKGGAPGLTEATREAVVGSIMLKITNKVLAPLLAAHQQVTAERDEEKARADRIDAKLGELNAAVRECLPPVDTLIAERQAAEAAYATATSELARLRAEGEAKDRALASLADNETLLLRAANLIDCGTAKHCEYFFHSKRVSGRHVPAQCARETEEGRGCLADDATSLRILSGKLREATALARTAQTAGGRDDLA